MTPGIPWYIVTHMCQINNDTQHEQYLTQCVSICIIKIIIVAAKIRARYKLFARQVRRDHQRCPRED